MDIDATVRQLWTVGEQHGRPPLPVPEVDPWDEPAAGSDGSVAVELPARPSIVVKLHPGGEDTIVLADVVIFDVPRQDTVAVVEALMAGRLRRRPDNLRGLSRAIQAMFILSRPRVMGSFLVVRANGREYTAPPPYDATGAAWFARIPVER
jgi:hypothetical protein